MTWKKHFKSVKMRSASHSNNSSPKYSHYASQLPEVYVGHPHRIERYTQYENMDIDSEVNAALDILAEFCTQVNNENDTVFDVHFFEQPSDNELNIINDQLIKWNNLNDFTRRIFKMVRNVLKYGDQVFIRDPETMEWHWVEMAQVIKVIVNEATGKEPEEYFIRNLNPNLQNKTATQKPQNSGSRNPNNWNQGYNQSTSVFNGTGYGGPSGGSRFTGQINETPVAAEHIVHLSLTEGLDANWPFGTSILESIYKVYKQKELLEDAILIYRIQRAPERRVFTIDTGDMPAHMAMAFVERVKNELHQRRIPNQTGGGNSILDTTYNPISINEDFFFPTNSEGRGSKVDVLPGGQNLSEIDDLRFFSNKMFRGLRIPASYLPTGPDESMHTFNDGRVGTALIQEYRFNEYCKRLQRMISSVFDLEFKIFLKSRGIQLDNSSFEIRFSEPQNFSAYRETELDATRISTFTSLEGYSYFSKRFLMQRYLGMSEEELAKNAKMWREEDDDTVDMDRVDMRSVGVTPGGIESDMDMFGGDDMGGMDTGEDVGGMEGAGGMGTGDDMGGMDDMGGVSQ